MSEAKVPEKGTFLWKFSKKFNFAAEKIIPDSFVFCVILMILVFVLSLLIGRDLSSSSTHGGAAFPASSPSHSRWA